MSNVEADEKLTVCDSYFYYSREVVGKYALCSPTLPVAENYIVVLKSREFEKDVYYIVHYKHAVENQEWVCDMPSPIDSMDDISNDDFQTIEDLTIDNLIYYLNISNK